MLELSDDRHDDPTPPRPTAIHRAEVQRRARRITNRRSFVRLTATAAAAAVVTTVSIAVSTRPWGPEPDHLVTAGESSTILATPLPPPEPAPPAPPAPSPDAADGLPTLPPLPSQALLYGVTLAPVHAAAASDETIWLVTGPFETPATAWAFSLDGQVLFERPLPTLPADIVADAGGLWIAQGTTDRALYLARETGEFTEIGIGRGQGAVALGDGVIWFAAEEEVAHVDALDKVVTARIAVPTTYDLAVRADRVMVTGSDGTLTEIDAASALVRSTRPVGCYATSIEAAGSASWVTFGFEDLARIDDTTGAVTTYDYPGLSLWRMAIVGEQGPQAAGRPGQLGSASGPEPHELRDGLARLGIDRDHGVEALRPSPGPGYDDDGFVILELDPVTLAVVSETPLPVGASLTSFGFRFSASDDHLWLWSGAWDAEADALGELSGIRFDPSDHSFQVLNPGRWITNGDKAFRITDTLERVDPDTLEVLNSVELEEPIDPVQQKVLIGSAGLYVSRPEGVALIDPDSGRSVITEQVAPLGFSVMFDIWGEIDGEMWRWDSSSGRLTPVR